MFSPVTVSIHSDDRLAAGQISLSKRLAIQWKINKGETLSVFFGLTRITVNISSIDGKENALLCHSSLLEQLGLSGEPLLRTCYLPTKRELILGPVVAVLTEVKEAADGVSFGTLASFCDELARLSEQSGCFFYVTSLSLWKEDDIHGYRYEQGAWIKETMPFPNIVHNRIHSRKTEQSTRFLAWLKQLKDYGVPHFNDRFLNKWEVYEMLQGYSYLQPYIPRTELFQSKQQLEELLAEHRCLFIKPIFGSQGRHIFKAVHEEEGFSLDYTTFTGDIQRPYASLDELFRVLRQYIGRRPYIMQQGLSLYHYRNRPVDFRILCHKTDENRWKATSAVARVSAEQQFVSNIAMGGAVYKPEEALQPAFSLKEARHIKKLLSELALEVAKCISLSYDGLYGELGIDMAVDTDGNPWLIEVNSKPSKNMIPDGTTGIRPSVRSILQYCCLAAKQPIKEG